MEEILEAVEKVKNGDDSYFHIIYERTRNVALAVIRKYCSSQSDYEDILQETYFKVYRNIGQLEDNRKIQPWINKIAANTAISASMKKKPMMFSEMADEEGNIPEFEDESGRFSPEIITGRQAVAQIVTEILDTLPEDQRTALWMVYGQKITIREMADNLRISENTIKSRLYQGRKKLLERKGEFQKLGVELTIIPVSVLISCAFDESVYGAAGTAGAGAAAGSTVFNGAAEGEISGASAGGSLTSSSAVGGAAAAAAGAGMSFGIKAAIGLACVVVAAGGGFAAKTIFTSHKEAAAEIQENEDENDIEKLPEDETEVEAEKVERTYEEISEEYTEDELETIAEETAEEENIEEAVGESVSETETETAGQESKGAVSAVFDHVYGTENESAVISGVDQNGNVVWTYETGQYGMAQLDRIGEIGSYNDTYYFVEDGAVMALNLSDGSVKWKNEDFVGSCTAYDFGEDGTLYLTGYLGPDLFVTDQNGNTIYRMESFESDYYWPYELICQDDGILLTMEGTPSGNPAHILVSYGDFSYRVVD